MGSQKARMTQTSLPSKLARRSQEEKVVARRSQEEPAGWGQEEPAGWSARRCQENPEGAKSSPQGVRRNAPPTNGRCAERGCGFHAKPRPCQYCTPGFPPGSPWLFMAWFPLALPGFSLAPPGSSWPGSPHSPTEAGFLGTPGFPPGSPRLFMAWFPWLFLGGPCGSSWLLQAPPGSSWLFLGLPGSS